MAAGDKVEQKGSLDRAGSLSRPGKILQVVKSAHILPSVYLTKESQQSIAVPHSLPAGDLSLLYHLSSL